MWLDGNLEYENKFRKLKQELESKNGELVLAEIRYNQRMDQDDDHLALAFGKIKPPFLSLYNPFTEKGRFLADFYSFPDQIWFTQIGFDITTEPTISLNVEISHIMQGLMLEGDYKILKHGIALPYLLFVDYKTENDDANWLHFGAISEYKSEYTIHKEFRLIIGTENVDKFFTEDFKIKGYHSPHLRSIEIYDKGINLQKEIRDLVI